MAHVSHADLFQPSKVFLLEEYLRHVKDFERLRPPDYVPVLHHHHDLCSAPNQNTGRQLAANLPGMSVRATPFRRALWCSDHDSWWFRTRRRARPPLRHCITSNQKAQRRSINSSPKPRWALIHGVIPGTQKQASPGLGIRLLDLHYPVYDELRHLGAAGPKQDCWPCRL